MLVPNLDAGGFAIGDSGDDPGDGSVALLSSTVEAVVVGELSFESDVDVEVLSLCWW